MDANQYYVRDSPSCVMAKVGKCADPRNLPSPRDRSAAQPGQNGDRAYTRYIIVYIILYSQLHRMIQTVSMVYQLLMLCRVLRSTLYSVQRR